MPRNPCMVKVHDIVLDHTVDPSGPPPEASAVLKLDDTSYSGNENADISFSILREDNTTQQIQVWWAITNAGATPNNGSVTFQPSDTSKLVTVDTGEVGPTEVGSLTLTAFAWNGIDPSPIWGTPKVASFIIVDSLHFEGLSDALIVSDSVTARFISSSASAPFPRLGHYAQGGWGPIGLDNNGGLFARLDLLGKYDYVIIGAWRNWVYDDDDGGPFYLKDLPTMIKARSTIDTKIFHYVDVCETYGTASGSSSLDLWERFREKLDSEVGPNGDWWLRDPNDCHVTSFPTVRSDCEETASTWRTNHSDLVTPDANGRRYPEFHAYAWHYDDRFDGPVDDSILSGVDGYGIRSEDGVEGIFCDVMKASGKVGADWDGDGSYEDKYGPEVIGWVTKGHKAHIDAWRALEPTFIITGNYAGNASQLDNYNLVPERFYDLVEGANSEWMMGSSSSHENWGDNENQLMLYYKRIMSFNAISRAAGTQTYDLFDGHSYEGYTGGMSQVGYTRYGLCICLQDDGWLSMKDNQIHSGWPLVCNEFDLDMGQALDPPDYNSSSSGYASYQNGVYKREFFNSATGVGYIAYFNPKNNGQQIITHPVHSGYQWNNLGEDDFVDPVEDPAVNDGATNVTTVTLDGRSGQIVKRVAV